MNLPSLPMWCLQMLVEAQTLHDQVLEARCRMAVTANRLVRLDNPIAAAQLAGIQVQYTPALAPE